MRLMEWQGLAFVFACLAMRDGRAHDKDATMWLYVYHKDDGLQ